MTLSELLSSISATKTRLKGKLGTSSDALYQYPTIIYNVLAYQFNQGYKEGWLSVKGTAYTGNDPKPLIDIQTIIPTWQGPVTNDLSNLTNLMSAIADIRVAMKTSFANCSVTVNDVFSTYPDAVDSGKTINYQNGKNLGIADATSSTPAQKVNTPTILTLSGNKYGIYSSNATSMTIWISNTAGGTAISGTTMNVTQKSITYDLPEIGNNKYLCVQAFATGMFNSDITSQLMSYVYPEVPVEPEPEVPSDVSFNLLSNNNGTAIMTLSTTTPGCSIKYTFNNWTQTNTINPNGSSTPTSGTIIITQNLTAGQLKAKAILNGVESEHVTSYQYALIVVQEEEDEDTPQNTPFWIKGTNQTSTYKIYTPEGTGKINISTRKDFNTIVTPSTVTKTINGTSTSVEEWTLNPDTYYYFRTLSTTASVAPKIEFNPGYSGTYSGTLKFALGGNLQYLSNKAGTAGTLPAYCFNAYFGQDVDSDSISSSKANYFWTQTITDISKLYFPDGGTYSYRRMFKCCKKLTTLPNTISCEIGEYACWQMFMYCNSITKGPNITSSSIGYYGCREMFDHCTAMTSTGNISATSVSANGMQYMFYYCSALVTGPAQLNCVRFTSYCYDSMFQGCTKLVKSPVINTQIDSNYGTPSNPLRSMFQNCSSLNYIEVNFNPNGYTFSNLASNWVKSVKSSGTFKVGPNGGNWSGIEVGVSGRPSGWTLS